MITTTVMLKCDERHAIDGEVPTRMVITQDDDTYQVLDVEVIGGEWRKKTTLAVFTAADAPEWLLRALAIFLQLPGVRTPVTPDATVCPCGQPVGGGRRPDRCEHWPLCLMGPVDGTVVVPDRGA